MKKKPKKENVHIGMRVPKSIQRAINKQCKGLSGYRITKTVPLTKKTRYYWDRILLTHPTPEGIKNFMRKYD